MRTDRVLLVRVGAERFAFTLGDVIEVVDAPKVERIPLLPEGVIGQAEHRGRLMPVVDLGLLVGVPREGGSGVLLVLALEGDRVGLLADDAVDAAVVPLAARRPVPATGANNGVLSGVLALDGGLAGVVDTDVLRAQLLARLATEAR